MKTDDLYRVTMYWNSWLSIDELEQIYGIEMEPGEPEDTFRSRCAVIEINNMVS